MFSNTKWFTLLEIIIAIIILSFALAWVYSIVQFGVGFVEKSRQEIIAINLAREGMEIVYQIRDTNRRRRAGKKDQCRLKQDPLQAVDSDACENDTWLGSGSYIISGNSVNDQSYFSLVPIANDLTIADTKKVSPNDLQYSLCLKQGIWVHCPGENSLTREGKFFRQIKGFGLFRKDTASTGDFLNCMNGTGMAGCGDSTAKEYRFCSIVQYVGKTIGKIELCGILTNFKK